MKKTSLLLAVLLSAFSSYAEETADSLPSQQLDEIVIQAPKVIRKADMDVYHPSQSAVEHSKNGMQLLTNLMIPSLTVDDILGTVTAAGENVQVRINGRETTIEQVRALLPETIKRVEWIDNPGLRYNGANYVLNIVVSNPTVGGSLQTMARPAVNQAWGVYFADAKFNTGRSQWDVGGNLKLANKIKTHRDYTETFTYTDGSSLTRTETSRGGNFDNTFGHAWASYSYIKPDTTVLYIEASANHKFTDRFHYDGVLTLSNGSEDIFLSDTHGDKGTTPELSAYLEQHFANRQTLVVDLKASLYSGRAYSDYIETPAVYGYLPDPTVDVHTSIKDRNQAYAVEANYIKNWNSSKLTAGASYSANRNRSVYENLAGEVFHQRQDKVYFFAEYFQRINKVSLTAGLGAQYTSFLFKESGQGRDSWNLRPQATVSYSINQNPQLRLSFQSWQSAPTLAQTNIAPQQVDGFQSHIGNPDLKTSTSYMLTLRYNFNLPRVAGSFGVRAFTSPDAITPLLYWQDNRLITTYENSRGLQNLSFFLSPQIEIIPSWLTASGYLQFRAERMRGTGYSLTNSAWSGHATIQLMHWGFVLTGQYIRSQHDLWGEKISWGENLSIIALYYDWKDWQFGAGMIMPFGKYDQGSRLLSKWNTNEQHMRLDMRMPYIQIGYNIQWGRQKRGAQKLVNADANADQSSTAGR